MASLQATPPLEVAGMRPFHFVRIIGARDQSCPVVVMIPLLGYPGADSRGPCV
jgi:hypothetical protein